MTQSQKPRIALTGGGTAGHVMPNLALLPELKARNFEVHYIGSQGIEQELAAKAGIPFHRIASGKLRRYLSIKNFFDIFKVVLGFLQSFFILLKLRPQVIFSKGGFVAVPVTVAGWALGIPVVSHESDYTPGLANRIIARFAKKLLYSFPETAKHISASKGVLVSTPIRSELFSGQKQVGLDLCGFQGDVPVILVMGGSQGAQRLNDALLAILPELVKKFCVVHLTGKGKMIPFTHARYRAFEFLGAELKDVFAATNLVVCRSGANSIFEMLALRIPMILIPLEVGSRGDQVLNANSFESRGWAVVLRESSMTPNDLANIIEKTYAERDRMSKAQEQASAKSGNTAIVDILWQLTLPSSP